MPVPRAPEVIASTTVVLKRQLRRFVLLDLLDAESLPERYRRGPRSQETGGGGGEGGGGTNYTYSTLSTSASGKGSDESHCNVLFTVRGKATRQRPQITTSEEKGEPKRDRIEQTSSAF